MVSLRVLLVLVLLMAACGSDVPPSSTTGTPIGNVRPELGDPADAAAAGGYADWDAVAVELEPGQQPSSTNPCQSGARLCLDLLVAEMQLRYDVLAEACDHDAVFALVYLRETEAIRDAIDGGQFQDPELFVHLTAWFAALYISSYDVWHFELGPVPPVWSTAFETARDRDARGIGNALLGINAHVSRDLAVAVADVYGLDMPDLPTRDYELVNQLIAEQVPGVVEELAARLDPDMSLAALPGLGGGFTDLVVEWRAQTWADGLELARATTPLRIGVLAELEATAEARSRAVRVATSYLPGVESSDSRDQHCLDQTS